MTAELDGYFIGPLGLKLYTTNRNNFWLTPKQVDKTGNDSLSISNSKSASIFPVPNVDDAFCDNLVLFSISNIRP